MFSQGGAVGLLLAGLTIPLVTASGWRASFVGLAIFGLAWGGGCCSARGRSTRTAAAATPACASSR
jgi:hypothetical protein